MSDLSRWLHHHAEANAAGDKLLALIVQNLPLNPGDKVLFQEILERILGHRLDAAGAIGLVGEGDDGEPVILTNDFNTGRTLHTVLQTGIGDLVASELIVQGHKVNRVPELDAGEAAAAAGAVDKMHADLGLETGSREANTGSHETDALNPYGYDPVTGAPNSAPAPEAVTTDPATGLPVFRRV